MIGNQGFRPLGDHGAYQTRGRAGRQCFLSRDKVGDVPSCFKEICDLDSVGEALTLGEEPSLTSEPIPP